METEETAFDRYADRLAAVRRKERNRVENAELARRLRARTWKEALDELLSLSLFSAVSEKEEGFAVLL